MSKNNTITIKNNWEELTLNEVTTISSILSADVPEEMKTIEVIAILTGEDRNEIENLPIFTFRKLANHLDFLNNPPEQAQLHKDYYEVNGRRYILQADIPTITAAQYIDYCNFSKEEPLDQRHLISCFLIPEGHSYNDGYDINQVWDDMGDLLFVDFQAIAFFLRRQYGLFTIVTLDYLDREAKKMKHLKKRERKSLRDQLHQLQNMVYSLTFSRSLK